MGRPTKFNKKVADRICDLIACSDMGIHRIYKKHNDLPHPATIMRWLNADISFREQYARAKEAQAEYMAEQIIEIADDGVNDLMTIERGEESYNVENKEFINRSRLRVDARKWIASKLMPKKFGDKVDLTTNGENINTEQVFKIGDTIIKL